MHRYLVLIPVAKSGLGTFIIIKLETNYSGTNRANQRDLSP